MQPASGSENYLKMQREAVYELRSCIKNKYGLSVLQFAAERGLVSCVQTMLTTKGVFVIPEDEETLNYKIDVTNLCPEYFVEGYQSSAPDKTSLLDALAEVQPPNKAGEILESIPMMTLTDKEWRVSRVIHTLWMIGHFILMLAWTFEVTLSNGKSLAFIVIFGIITLIYSTVLTAGHVAVKIHQRKRQNVNQQNDIFFVKDSFKEYTKIRDDKGVTAIPQKLLNETILFVEVFFMAFAWTFCVSKITTFDAIVWSRGFFLLFGWLMLLVPMTSYNRVYKLISVLKYIIMYDVMPWILIYMTITLGFALAIKLEFEELPKAEPCTDDQPDLTGQLQDAGHALFELIIMTSGLDTDIKNIRGLFCLFKYNSKSVFLILFFVTLYAVISAVVLLNMLIAIMSNTVTEAQQDKGWRQYQVSVAIYFSLQRNSPLCSLVKYQIDQSQIFFLLQHYNYGFFRFLTYSQCFCSW